MSLQDTNFTSFKEPETFLHLGHSSDICDNNKMPIVETVPEGCTVLQASTCGASTSFDTTNLDYIIQSNQSYFKDPLNNLLEINKLLKEINIPSLKIHNSNTPIVKSVMTLLSFLSLDGYDTLEPSGIYNLSQNLNPYALQNIFSLTNPITIQEFSSVFRGSVFPTEKAVLKHLSSDLANSNLENPGFVSKIDCRKFIIRNKDPFFGFFIYDFRNLVSIIGGVHIHLLCRDVSRDCYFGAAAQRMTSSGGNSSYIDKFTRQVLKTKKISGDEEFETILRTASVEEVKHIFTTMLYLSDEEKETFLIQCWNKKGPRYYAKRIMEMRKGNPEIFRDILQLAVDACPIKGESPNIVNEIIRTIQQRKAWLSRSGKRRNMRKTRKSHK
jgi:hypothetical protein